MLSYNGFNTKVITMPKSTEDELLGKAINVGTDGNAIAATKNGEFIGICVGDHGDYACVQVEGYIESKYTGTVSSLGWAHIVAGDGNAVAISTTAGTPMRRIMRNDATNKVIGYIL